MANQKVSQVEDNANPYMSRISERKCVLHKIPLFFSFNQNWKMSCTTVRAMSKYRYYHFNVDLIQIQIQIHIQMVWYVPVLGKAKFSKYGSGRPEARRRKTEGNKAEILTNFLIHTSEEMRERRNRILLKISVCMTRWVKMQHQNQINVVIFFLKTLKKLLLAALFQAGEAVGVIWGDWFSCQSSSIGQSCNWVWIENRKIK